MTLKCHRPLCGNTTSGKMRGLIRNAISARSEQTVAVHPAEQGNKDRNNIARARSEREEGYQLQPRLQSQVHQA